MIKVSLSSASILTIMVLTIMVPASYGDDRPETMPASAKDDPDEYEQIGKATRIAILKDHEHRVNAIAIDPLNESQFVSCDEKGNFFRWDIPTRQVVWKTITQESNRNFFTAQFSSDGRYIVVGSLFDYLALFDAANGKELLKYDLPAEVAESWSLASIEFSPNLEYLAANNRNGDDSVGVWDALGGDLINSFGPKVDGQVHTIEFSEDGRYLATVGKFQICIWNILTGAEVRCMQLPIPSRNNINTSIKTASFTPGFRYMAFAAFCSLGDIIGVFDTQSEEIIAYDQTWIYLTRVAISSDLTQLAGFSGYWAWHKIDIASQDVLVDIHETGRSAARIALPDFARRPFEFSSDLGFILVPDYSNIEVWKITNR